MIDKDIEKICGYNVDELVTFAYACRRQGITEDDLHNFVGNISLIVSYVIDELKEDLKQGLDTELLYGKPKIND